MRIEGESNRLKGFFEWGCGEEQKSHLDELGKNARVFVLKDAICLSRAVTRVGF